MKNRKNKSPENFKKKNIFLLLFYGCSIFCYNLYGNEQVYFDSLSREFDKNILLQGTKSRSLLHNLYQIAYRQDDNFRLLVQCFYRESCLNYDQATHNSDTLMKNINDYLCHTNKKKYAFEKGLLYYSLTLHYITKGSYADAFSAARRALDEFEALKDSTFIAKTTNALGNICASINLYHMAEDYYRQAEKYTKKYQTDYYKIRSNLFCLLFLNLQQEAAIDSFLVIIPEIQYYRDTAMLITVYFNLESCYAHRGDEEQAYYYHCLAEKLLYRIDNIKFTLSLYEGKGCYFTWKEDYEQALQWFMKGKKMAEERGSILYLSSALLTLSFVFFELGYSDSAFVYLLQYQELKERLTSNEKTIEAYQAYISAILDASENKLKSAIKHQRLTIGIMLAVFLLVLIIILLILVQRKKRIKEMENVELSKQLEHEKNIQQIQEELLASKMREVTSYSLQLSNKNNVLSQISDLAKQRFQKQEETENIIIKIEQIVKNNFKSDNDWQNFKLHFDKVHPDFFEHLKNVSDQLTENNLRLCAYFRIGLSNKQIAQIMNISHNSVILSRVRLKKKLKLKEDENLSDFLRNINGIN
jgi:DNA-binding CsgD family transcriptional regulator